MAQRTPLDDVMVSVLDVVERAGGVYRSSPGEALRGLSVATGEDYFAVAKAVRTLEAMGLVKVDRWHYPKSARANPVVAVSLVDT